MRTKALIVVVLSIIIIILTALILAATKNNKAGLNVPLTPQSSADKTENNTAIYNETSGKQFFEGIQKLDLQSSTYTQYTITGYMDTAPTIDEKGNYSINLKAKDNIFNVLLGKQNNVIGVNFAVENRMSDKYENKNLASILEDIKINRFVTVYITTSIQEAESYKTQISCDSQCRELLDAISMYGESVEKSFTSVINGNANKNQPPFEVKIPISQTTISSD